MSIRYLLFALLTFLAAAVAVLCFIPPADAGWGGGGCPSCGPVGPVYVQPAPAPVVAHDYHWRPCPGDGGDRYAALMDGREQVGVWDYQLHGYCKMMSADVFADAGVWPCPTDPPPPCRCDRCKGECRCAKQDECKAGALPGDKLPTGVVSALISADEKYSKNGVGVSKPAAFEAMQAGGQVPDDSGKPSLTVIGTDAEVAPVLADLARPENAAARAAVLVQSYPPDAVMVGGLGFTPGHPAVYLQAADGKVLYHEPDYCPARLFAAVRRADPSYDPARDPNGETPGPLALLEKLPLWVYVAAAVAGLVWWSRRKR